MQLPLIWKIGYFSLATLDRCHIERLKSDWERETESGGESEMESERERERETDREERNENLRKILKSPVVFWSSSDLIWWINYQLVKWRLGVAHCTANFLLNGINAIKNVYLMFERLRGAYLRKKKTISEIYFIHLNNQPSTDVRGDTKMTIFIAKICLACLLKR